MPLITLADAVLPLIRTTSRELWRYSNAMRHGAQMRDGVAILELAVNDPAALPATLEILAPTPEETYRVVHKALASGIRIIARADDSSGVIGDAIRDLIAIHPVAAAAAHVPPLKLADWMWKFHFDEDVDYFELDPVAYSPALGKTGLTRLRADVEDLRHQVAAQAGDHGYSHEAFLLRWFDQRLAVLDGDVDAIIRTHLREAKVAAWFTDTAKALAEIERYDLAIEWARKAMEFDRGHQARQGGNYWWGLVGEHAPDDLPDAAWTLFHRWPGSDTAARVDRTVGASAREEIIAALEATPSALVYYLVDTVGDVEVAWDAAHRLGLDDRHAWDRLAAAYETIDPAAAIEVHLRSVAANLVEANTRAYRPAARELARLRGVAGKAGPEAVSLVDAAIADLRERYRRRPSMLDAFDRAHLP